MREKRNGEIRNARYALLLRTRKDGVHLLHDWLQSTFSLEDPSRNHEDIYEARNSRARETHSATRGGGVYWGNRQYDSRNTWHVSCKSSYNGLCMLKNAKLYAMYYCTFHQTTSIDWSMALLANNTLDEVVPWLTMPRNDNLIPREKEKLLLEQEKPCNLLFLFATFSFLHHLRSRGTVYFFLTVIIMHRWSSAIDHPMYCRCHLIAYLATLFSSLRVAHVQLQAEDTGRGAASQSRVDKTGIIVLLPTFM